MKKIGNIFLVKGRSSCPLDDDLIALPLCKIALPLCKEENKNIKNSVYFCLVEGHIYMLYEDELVELHCGKT